MSDQDIEQQDSTSDLFSDLREKVKSVILNWSIYSALGTFLLYLFGYLSLRFRLSVYGIRTDLPLLDENYFFAGAYFLIYAISFLPIILLLLALLLAVGYGVFLLVPVRFRPSLNHSWCTIATGTWSWWSVPTTFMVIATLFSIIVIQFLMRHCFLLGDTLLTQSLPDHEWLHSIVFSENTVITWLFFPGILVSAALSIMFLRIGGLLEPKTIGSRTLWGTLACCTVIQILMLPVNYGMLFASQNVPRLTSLGNKDLFQDGRDAWLLWSDKQSLTYLLREQRNCSDVRRLITVPRKKVAKVEVAASQQIFRVLFSDDMALAEMKRRVRDHRRLDEKSSKGSTPLIEACENGHFKTAKFLLSYSKVNAVNDQGETAMIVSAKKGCAKLVELLVNKGADVNVTDKSGKTALAWAVEKTFKDIGEILATAKPKP